MVKYEVVTLVISLYRKKFKLAEQYPFLQGKKNTLKFKTHITNMWHPRENNKTRRQQQNSKQCQQTLISKG